MNMIPKCARQGDIDHVAKHLGVETWVMDEKVDFSLYNRIPVNYEMIFK